MPKRTQYPIHAKLDLPEALRPEVTVVDKWYQPFSEPIRRKPGVLAAAALLASGAVFVAEPSDLPSFNPADDGLTWSVPLNEPVRTVPIVPAALMQVVADDLTIWPQQVTPFGPSISQDSMVGAVQRTQYQAVVEPLFVLDVTGPGPEEIEWYVPPSEPTLPLPPRQTAGEAVSPTGYPGFVTGPGPAEIEWWTPLSEPVLPRPSYAALATSGDTNANEILPSPLAITLDTWYQPLSEPTLPPLPRQTAGEAAPPAFFGPEVTVVDKWFQPFREPVLPFPPRQIAGETHANEILPAPAEDIFPDSWQQPLFEPVLPREQRETAGEVAASPFIGPEVTDPGKWFQPLSEPVLPRPSYATLIASGEFHANEILPEPAGEDITLDKWFQPLAEPVQTTPPLPVGAMPSFVTDAESLTLPEVTTVDRWFVRLSEPVLPPERHLQLEDFAPPAFFGPEASDPGKWFQALSEPVLPAPTFAYLRSGPVDDVNIWPPAEVVTLDKWYVPLSLPTPPPVTFAHLMAGAFDANETLPEPEVVPVFDANLRLGYHENVVMGGQPSLGGR